MYFAGKVTWKLVTHIPNYIPGKNVCQFACACNLDVALTTPELYDMTSDPGETSPIDSNSEIYKEIAPLILNAIKEHKNTIEPVETEFTWRKLLPNLRWQPCCNGTFPFNCDCVDEKYSSLVK